jgi:hypothetical protein
VTEAGRLAEAKLHVAPAESGEFINPIEANWLLAVTMRLLWR